VTPGRGLESEFHTADESPGFLLWQVTNRWQASQRAALRPLGLTHVQFVLLASLAWLRTDGPLNQRILSEHAGTDPMMTSQVLRSLEGRGLVERTTDPDDRRARKVAVTARGRDLANRANLVVEACDRSFFGPIGDRAPLVEQLVLLRAGPPGPDGQAPHSRPHQQRQPTGGTHAGPRSPGGPGGCPVPTPPESTGR